MKQDSIVFDTFALLTFLKGEDDSTKVGGYLHKIQDKQLAGYLSAVNLSELYYITMRENGYEDAEVLAASLKDWGLQITTADEELAKRAGQLKAQYAIPLADAFAAATAQAARTRLLTGDLDFQKLEQEIQIEWISRGSSKKP
ncbi:MAG: type II toxin-antitoxin system VapC family toxin [Chloroflexi bacterium]|nr:type II toxin-antitoxin system VapC family toxin [Chloroflexota bacterium]MBM3182481.1 type II toxin-antitoxin system VapC family toxin [Chloroflexota bacterium]MBM4451092.1 type II toxin-antitoxin system VapC family toxin [Chloroflexota bacterium]MBM4453674.1 type II toxin-antitoxin system VapC family toxin [Chloroflexota bacterium]